MQHSISELDDEQLACEAQAGSVPCFEELVRRYQVPLLRFLLRKLPLRADAEDVLQDAFVRAFRNLARYRPRWPFRAWIFTIAYRLAISHGRNARTRQHAEVHTEPLSADDTPPQRLGRAEQRQAIWHTARAVLNDEQYTAVWLYYVEELPAGEVARVMGRSWVSVKTMLHRARKRLLPHLAPMLEPAPCAPAVKAGGI